MDEHQNLTLNLTIGEVLDTIIIMEETQKVRECSFQSARTIYGDAEDDEYTKLLKTKVTRCEEIVRKIKDQIVEHSCKGRLII